MYIFFELRNIITCCNKKGLFEQQNRREVGRNDMRMCETNFLPFHMLKRSSSEYVAGLRLEAFLWILTRDKNRFFPRYSRRILAQIAGRIGHCQELWDTQGKRADIQQKTHNGVARSRGGRSHYYRCQFSQGSTSQHRLFPCHSTP